MKKKMIAAGHICIDITPVINSEKIENITDILAPGGLVHVKEADIHTGGSVANTGLAMKILGGDVSLMGKVGKDEFGRMILNILEKYDAGSGMIVEEDASTSYSVVLAIPGIDRIFLHNSGANDTFSVSDLNMELIKEAQLFHFGYPPLMENLYKEDGKRLAELFETVKKTGVITSMDMAAVTEQSQAGLADWNIILEKTLPYVDFIFPSFEEICFMLDKEKYHMLLKRAAGKDITTILSIQEDVVPLAEVLLAMGVKFVVIKCGAAGFYYKAADKELFAKLQEHTDIDFSSFAGKEGFEKSYVPDDVISATGAGDTMIAAFLTAMIQGYSLERCLQLAAATGASCVATVDALSGLQTFDALIKKIDAGWQKQNLVDYCC